MNKEIASMILEELKNGAVIEIRTGSGYNITADPAEIDARSPYYLKITTTYNASVCIPYANIELMTN